MKTKVLLGLLFVGLTAIYFRFVICAPEGALLTNHLATDLYGHFVHVWGRLNLLREGFIPLGDYWVLRGGGFPAALNDQVIMQHELLLTAVYTLTHNLEQSLRVLIPFFYLATLATAYWYGKVLFKRTDASVVLAVAYAFCAYSVNQLEHLELIGVQPFILLALIYLEKTLQDHRPLHIVLTGLFLLLVATSNMYPLYFLMLFIIARLSWHIVSSPQRLKTAKSAAKIGVVFLVALVPLILPTLLNMPTQEAIDGRGAAIAGYAQPPILYFLRNAPYEPYTTETYVMYMGIVVLLLAAVPMVLRRDRKGLYIFHVALASFFMLYAVGQYGPVNLASWIHDHAPLAFFIQVPGRAMVMGYLSLAVCAAYGFTLIADRLPKHRYLLVLVAVVAIFADLTIGFEHHTMPAYFQPTSAYEFVGKQPGDFRVVEVPLIHGQQAMTTIYTEHDTVGPTLWAFGLFAPLEAFTTEYENYTNSDIDAYRSAQYNVRYVIVNTDPEYYTTFERALEALNGPTLTEVQELDRTLEESQDYTLVHSSSYTKVYENTAWQGLVTSEGADYLTWSQSSPNCINIDYSSALPTVIQVSQSYSEGWVASSNGATYTIANLQGIQAIAVPEGTRHVTLQYVNYTTWVAMALGFLAALVCAILCIWRRKLWPVLIAVGIGLTILAFTMVPPLLYQYATWALGGACILSGVWLCITRVGGSS